MTQQPPNKVGSVERQPSSPPHRLSAEEVRKKYGVGAVLLLAWETWCIYDGWFHPHYEYIGFSRFMAYISAPALAFCVIMTVSAARALQRHREQIQPPPGSSPPTQSNAP